jgi:hypothetical protein
LAELQNYERDNLRKILDNSGRKKHLMVKLWIADKQRDNAVQARKKPASKNPASKNPASEKPARKKSASDKPKAHCPPNTLGDFLPASLLEKVKDPPIITICEILRIDTSSGELSKTLLHKAIAQVPKSGLELKEKPGKFGDYMNLMRLFHDVLLAMLIFHLYRDSFTNLNGKSDDEAIKWIFTRFNWKYDAGFLKNPKYKDLWNLIHESGVTYSWIDDLHSLYSESIVIYIHTADKDLDIALQRRCAQLIVGSPLHEILKGLRDA